ncbi:MAG: alpha-N-arabinofuranosidase [Sphingomonadales bacterium]|nr:alpha-N-arabinofuranosidase [Sphingomonadales bacterium]
MAEPVALTLHADRPGPTISRDVFGQFSEMLGNGVEGGIWVGRDSPIANVRGIRSDVVAALRAIRVPVVRWPGGCFADRYAWRDGIGPAAARTSTVNMWGNVVEPNQFGSDEYMDFLGQIGAEAYITINVGSGTPAEASQWLEYMTTDQPSTLGRLRAVNGHPAPYRIKYLGIGNEAWGCGGAMTADQYVGEYRRFATYATNLNPAQNGPVKFVRGKDAMQDIAAGPDGDNTEYTEAVMKAWAHQPVYGWTVDGLSLHYYTGGSKGVLASPATGFGADEYAASVQNTLKMERIVALHSAIMDKYDPARKVALVVDEWGLWATPQAGTNFMFLRQQGSMRDAIVTALNLAIFARHADRVRMANIAQMVNVIQAMILTDGPKLVLTPTYHVYRMIVPFQDATAIPMELDAGDFRQGGITLPRVDGMAARARDGAVWVALTNIDPARPADIAVRLEGASPQGATGEVLTAPAVDTVNSFDQPAAVAPRPVRFRASGGRLVMQLPPRSVTVVRVDR